MAKTMAPILSLLLLLLLNSKHSISSDLFLVRNNQKNGCESVENCLWDAGVVELDSESHRRQLWDSAGEKKYISYEALKGDVVPCNKPGVPYYNCRMMARAGPYYTRGCSAITECRGSAP